MSTTSEYLQQLQTDKQNLVDNLVTKGVSATSNETFTSLVPKVLDIQSGGTDAEITDASYLFYNGTRLDYLNELLNLCKNVTSTYQMFYLCSTLKSVDLSDFDMSNVTTMYYMFYMCTSLKSIIWKNGTTSKNTDMGNVFYACNNLESIDLSNFDTSNVTSFVSLFYNCQRLAQIDVSNFNTSNAKQMDYMFYGCIALSKIDISNFDGNKLISNSLMFGNCSNLLIVIINRQDVFKMTNTNMFQNTPIASGTGFVYVPDNMVETYKSATNWSTYADQIKGMSELPPEEAQ